MFDWREYAWKLVFRPLDRVAELVGLYTTTSTDRDEYVGTVRQTEPQVEAAFRDWGLSRSLLSSAHVRETERGDQTEDAAFVWRPWAFSRYQVHILIFANYDGTTAIYAHFERNPWRTPFAHYAGEDADAAEGRRLAKRIIWNRLDWDDGPVGGRQEPGE